MEQRRGGRRGGNSNRNFSDRGRNSSRNFNEGGGNCGCDSNERGGTSSRNFRERGGTSSRNFRERGGTSNRNANHRGGGHSHQQQHHHERQQGRNFENDEQYGDTATQTRFRGRHHDASGRGRSRPPYVGEGHSTRNRSNYSSRNNIQQGLSVEEIETMESSGNFGRKNQGFYGSSQSISSTHRSEAYKPQGRGNDRRHSSHKAVGRRPEVLFGGDYNGDDDFRNADIVWRIPRADNDTFQEDNVSVYSTDSYSSPQNSNYGSDHVLTRTHAKHPHGQSVTSVSYDFPKIGIYWDIENCPVPSEKSALHLVKRIRDNFCANTHTEDEFVVVCDTAHQKKDLLDQLSKAQVDVQHMNATSKNASDDMLRRKINDFAERNDPPAKVLLITGDINFGPDIHKLNYKRHFRVVLLHNKQASNALLMLANECISYESFCHELPKLQNAGTITEQIPAILEVCDLPHHVSVKTVRGRLDKLFSHFGGKIVHMSNPPQTALVKFAAVSDARKAQPRIDGQDVHGACIKVRFFENDTNEIINSNKSQSTAHKAERFNETETSCGTPPTKQKQEKVEPPVGNTCVVRFVISGTAGVKELTNKLQPHLIVDDFQVLSSQNEQTCCLIKLPSLAKAKKTVKCLNSLKILTVLSTEILKGDENCSNISSTISPLADAPKQSDMQKLRDNFNKMRQAYFDRHEARTKELKDKLWELREQMSSSESYNRDPRLEAFEKAIVSQLNVMTDVQKEFDAKTEKLVMNFLRSKMFDSSSNTSQLMAECHLFVSATPVYAVRSIIESKVAEGNFVLVSGPPGTSKSTQVIQCLFHAEVCSTEVTIACTQPYKELVIDHGVFVASQVKSAVGKQITFFKTRKNALGSQSAQLLYLPDYMLLEETLADPTLSNYGCIILDEVQQRSLPTELLLIYLESLMNLRKDLKVVILSTPARAQVLRQRLKRLQEIPLSVEPYPVDIIWRSSAVQTHMEACVKLAIQLHLAEDGGDILIFLASTSEVVQAEALLLKELAKRSDVCIVQMVLSISFKEMRKKMSLQNAVRNIILTCNDLEDVISIPSVKYVVDAGLSTESSWVMSQEVIEIKYISQFTAAMRANKAGMRTAGQCYRLYSPEQYTDSVSKGPERKELELMVLKLCQMSIDPLKYNYIHAPDHRNLVSVLKQLEEIGAISNNKLTSIGKKMAALTLQPHLSFMLLEAHKKKEGYPALVLCAIACVTKCFTHPRLTKINDEFPTGDLLSLITLIQTWFSVKPVERKQLIADNKIDPFVIDVIQDKVMELHESLKNIDVRIKLVQESRHWPQTLATLLKEYWVNNLCVLHHPPTRTYHCQKTNQYLILLPNCCARGRPLPKYIVFEKLWKTPWGEFISNVFPIDEAVLQAGFERDVHNLHPNDTIVYHVGLHLMRSVVVGPSGEKLAYWEKLSGELPASRVLVKAFQSRGQVVVNAPESTRSEIVTKLKNALDSGRKLMLNERWEYSIKNYPGIRIHWGQAAEALQLLMSNDFARVLVIVPESMPLNKILTTFRKYGRTVHQSEKVTKHGKKQVVIMYETPEAARKAINCKEYSVKPMSNLFDNYKPQSGLTHVTATWIRRKNLGTAIVELKAKANIAVASVYFETERLPNDCFDGVVILPEDDKDRIVIRGLPQHVSRLELEETINHCLESMPKDTVAAVSMTQVKAFESSAHDVMIAQEQLQSLFSHYGQKVTVSVRQPEVKDDLWTAALIFENENAGQVIIDDLSTKASINGDPVHFKSSYQCFVNCSSIIFDHIKNKYVSLVNRRQAELCNKRMAVRASAESLPDTDDTSVNIYGLDILEVKRVYQELIKLLQDALVINISKRCINVDLFYKDGVGRTFIDGLQQKYASLCTVIALKKKMIMVYGKEASKVERDIAEFLELESAKLLSLPPQQIVCETVGMIRELVTRYGLDLCKLKEESKAYKLTLDVKAKVLKIHADSEAMDVIRVILQEAKSKLAKQTNERKLQSNSTAETCPICLDSVSNSAVHYRLEYCGHAYCEPCMAAYLDTTTPPIRCLYADCDGPLVFRDLSAWQRLQSLRYPGVLDRLAERTTMLYVERHQSVVRFCPLLSCEGILKIDSDCQLCSKCQNNVCTRCNVLYHYGDTCSEFQKGLKPTTALNNISVMKKSSTSPEEKSLTAAEDKLAELKRLVSAYRYKPDQTNLTTSVTNPTITTPTSDISKTSNPSTSSPMDEFSRRIIGPPPLSPFRPLTATSKTTDSETSSVPTRTIQPPTAARSHEPPVSTRYTPSPLGVFPSTSPAAKFRSSASVAITRSATSPTVSYYTSNTPTSPTSQTSSTAYFPPRTTSQAVQGASVRSYPATPVATTNRPIAENRPLARSRSSTSQDSASASKSQTKADCIVM